ncbi:MAG: DUF2007 domain-containing protein [Chloroflexi bacterium]|nr:DUF2007 domain-containing protein [Chloroflexota bacterium]
MSKSRETEKLVHVATAPNPVIAASWQEALRAEGIESVLKIDDPLGVAYQVSSFYPCRIYVLAGYAERARQLLDEMVFDDTTDEMPEEED